MKIEDYTREDVERMSEEEQKVFFRTLEDQVLKKVKAGNEKLEEATEDLIRKSKEPWWKLWK